MRTAKEVNMLADERSSLGLTQREMADMLNLPYSTYCEYETGKKSIPAKVVKQIAEILGKPVTSLFLPIRFTLSKQKK